MLDNLLLTEVIATCKRDDLEHDIAHALLVSQAGRQSGGFHPRRAVAGALVRVAAVIDSNAGHGARATAH
jgi:hypothetical protein